VFIVALFIIAKLWKQPRCPTIDEWIRKMWYLYTIEFYSATNKNDRTGEDHLKFRKPKATFSLISEI
jgi:hypothetical protein